MSAEALETAWASDLRGSERLVLLALAWRAPKGETAAAAAVADLARLAGLSADQTRRVLRRLVQTGVIRRTHAGGGRQAATYELIHNPLHSYATPGEDATPCTAMPPHPLHSYASAPLAQLCKPVKEKNKNSPSSARARACGAGLEVDGHGITHNPSDPRDAEALRQIAQHAPESIAAAVASARQTDPLGRAWPSKVLRLLIAPATQNQRQSAQATPTPAWATCADWLN
jgi:predicted transcriptional regulator